MLRARAALLAAARQHRRRIHRPRVSLRRKADHARRPRRSSDGQAARRPARRRRMLHQSRACRSERLRESRDAARDRGMQLLHGGADGRRRDALLSINQLPRRRSAAHGPEPPTRTRVRAMVRASRNHPRRPPHRPRRSANADRPTVKEPAANSDFDTMRKSTPARLGLGRAGPRYTTAAMLSLRADHARAVDAVMTEVAHDWPQRNGLLEVHSQAATREDYLRYPERGRRLTDADARRVARLKPRRSRRGPSATPTVLLCVGDGLSSAAVEKNAGPLMRALTRALASRYQLLHPIFVRNARVRIEDHLGDILRPDVVCMIVGERPGLVTAESLSAYVIYRPTLKSIEPDRTVISNIHRGGVPIAKAARKIAALLADTIKFRASGAALAQTTSPAPTLESLAPAHPKNYA